jgi:hypothetical protein
MMVNGGTAKQTAAQNEREAEDDFGVHGLLRHFIERFV